MTRQYPRLDLRFNADEIHWIEQQAANAGLNRSRWAKARILGYNGDRHILSERSGHDKANGHTTLPFDRQSEQSSVGRYEGDRRLEERIGDLITQWSEVEPERYTPTNPLSQIRETGLLTHQLLTTLKTIRLDALSMDEREQILEAIAAAQRLQKLCTHAARAERG